MPMSRMEMNGRIVVPKEIRRAVGAKLGTRFIWELSDDGSIRVVAKSKPPTIDAPSPSNSDESAEGELNA